MLTEPALLSAHENRHPGGGQARIRKWLDWGRKNVEYLQVRKDLPDWPAPSTVDGSSHLVGDRGFVFLFNPNNKSLDGQFTLNERSMGLRDLGSFRLSQVYPPANGASGLLLGRPYDGRFLDKRR